MADVHDKATRSYNMSRIRGKDTKPEMVVRRFLFGMGYRYRVNDARLPGKPDIVLPKYKTVIFIHGCFWHGHKACRYFVIPKTRKQFWINKIESNRDRDKINTRKLKKTGWRVIEVWECGLKANKVNRTLRKLAEQI